ICAFGLASAVPRSPYRHLKLCGIALNTILVYYRGLYDGAQENLHQTGKKTLAFGNKSDV
ncbi:MAG: hypothetical protein ACLUI4_12780, partial [Faecalibacterium sp.]